MDSITSQMQDAKGKLAKEMERVAQMDKDRKDAQAMHLEKVRVLEADLTQVLADADDAKHKAAAARAAAASAHADLEKEQTAHAKAEEEAKKNKSQLELLGRQVDVLAGVLRKAKARGLLSHALDREAQEGLLAAERESALAEARRLAAETGRLAGHQNTQ